MPNQVLTIDPQNELQFKGMFEQGCTTYLRLANPTADTVLFKIKTTAPKKYCVRPNSGTLDPYSKVEIAITPQPVYIDMNEKHKHKFMVQSVIAPEDKSNVDQVWKEISPEQLMEHKFKCVFEMPRSANANLNDAGDTAAQNDANKILEAKPASKDAVENVTHNDVKIPKDGEVSSAIKAKTSLTFTKSDNAENDLQKASLEVVHLREEESKLRHENLLLKEDLLRMKQAMTDGRAAARSHSFGPGKQAPSGVVPWLATALAMALLGIIIGKFFM